MSKKTHESTDIIFDHETYFIGRNGMGRCSGVQAHLSDYQGHLVIILEPLTSRGVSGNCQIVLDCASIVAIATHVLQLNPLKHK